MSITPITPDDLSARAHLLYCQLQKTLQPRGIDLYVIMFGSRRHTRLTVNLGRSYMLEVIEGAARPYLRAHTVHGGAQPTYKHFQSGLFDQSTLTEMITRIRELEAVKG